MDILQEFTNDFSCRWNTVQKELDEGLLQIIVEQLKAKTFPLTNRSYTQVSNRWGIYLFQIRTDCNYHFESLKKAWEDDAKAIGYRKFPKVYKGRFQKLAIEHTESDTPYAFYLGKSEKLGHRIEQHITHDQTNATYGLKLKGRPDFYDCISYSFWELPIEHPQGNRAVAQFVLTQLEHALRNQLHPLIGKQ